MSNPAFVDSTGVDPDLPITPNGMPYHLSCTSADLADRIILVGDPARISLVVDCFDPDSVRFRGSHRELYIVTGAYNGTPVSVVSIGMGTGSLEIVVNEIHVLKEYDAARRVWRTRVGDPDAANKKKEELFDPASVKMIRVGTCGSPVPTMPISALVITRYVVGMDNVCLFYNAPEMTSSPDLQEIRRAVRENTGLRNIDVYAAKAHPSVTQGLVDACEELNRKLAATATGGADPNDTQQVCVVGTTVTASGFYAPQGRVVGRFRNHIALPNLVDELGRLRMNVSEGTEVVANIEMETSALCYLGAVLGYPTGAVCVVVAKRAGETREFATAEQAKKGMRNAIRVALNTIVSLK